MRCRSGPLNQRPSGISNPCFGRDSTDSGTIPLMARRNNRLLSPAVTRKLPGIRNAKSTRSKSNSGTRASSETAMLVRSTFVRMSPGRYESMSVSIMAAAKSSPSSRGNVVAQLIGDIYGSARLICARNPSLVQTDRLDNRRSVPAPPRAPEIDQAISPRKDVGQHEAQCRHQPA